MKFFKILSYIFFTLKAYLALLIILTLITIATPFALIFVALFDKEKKVYQYATKIFIKLFFLLNFININKKIDYNGVEKPKDGEKRIYVLNHQSLLDGLLIFLMPGNVKFMANEMYAKIPIFGLGVSFTGNIAVKRGEDSGYLNQYYQAGEILDNSYPLVIFPEGTRNRDGNIGKFYNSAFMLALEKNASIVPVVIKTWNVLRPGEYIVRNNDFKVKFLDMIKYEDIKDKNYKDISNEIREKMIAELESLKN